MCVQPEGSLHHLRHPQSYKCPHLRFGTRGELFVHVDAVPRCVLAAAAPRVAVFGMSRWPCRGKQEPQAFLFQPWLTLYDGLQGEQFRIAGPLLEEAGLSLDACLRLVLQFAVARHIVLVPQQSLRQLSPLGSRDGAVEVFLFGENFLKN